MSQRNSGYLRKDRDCYETPEWVTHALIPHIRTDIRTVWEPACGSGKMVDGLWDHYRVTGSDVVHGIDFLSVRPPGAPVYDAIITNPPFQLAQKFIKHALMHVSDKGVVAMLLRCDFDHAKTRQHLFGECPQFAKKVALTRRIVWFDRPGVAPSFNHAWFIWDWKHQGAPTLAYSNGE